MPKVVRKKMAPKRHDDALADTLIGDEATRNLRTKPRTKTKKKAPRGEDDDDREILNPAMSKKVLASLAEQQDEDEEEFNAVDMTGAAEGDNDEFTVTAEDVAVDDDGFLQLGNLCTEEEEAALSMFMPKQEQEGSRSLADIVLEQLRMKSEQPTAQHANEALESTMEQHEKELPPKVIETYTDIGKWLKTYKSGKLPKPFLVIPSLENWEEILCLTNPLDWTPNAVREATKIFASQLNARMAQRFYNLVLLPAVRQEMLENKKLNFHYYEALKKAIFKPAAFMKGILLPLAQENCTLREAHILCSVLARISVPVLHASAVLVKLAQMTPWYGTTAMFIATLVNKKYSLPVSVIGALCDHFYSFVADERELPLVWHRALLVFVQRYKTEFSQEQRLRFRSLLKVHRHEGVSAEVKRELLSTGPFRSATGTTIAGTTVFGMDIDG